LLPMIFRVSKRRCCSANSVELCGISPDHPYSRYMSMSACPMFSTLSLQPLNNALIILVNKHNCVHMYGSLLPSLSVPMCTNSVGKTPLVHSASAS
jgi:hypothetical protein